MKAAVFAYSRQGCKTARRVMEFLQNDECRAFTIERFKEPDFRPIPNPSRSHYAACFAWADALIFVGSCGIAVREIAPFVTDKKADPAVLCFDELGRFVIPLLSGHIGGANELALKLAGFLGAAPVITTATDINRKFSVDTWAARNGYAISSMHAAKAVSAAVLERDVPLTSDFPIVTELPAGVTVGESGHVGICLTYRKQEPFGITLRLIPKILHLGIGCRRGTEVSAIREAVNTALNGNDIDRHAIKSVVSIDIKATEQGLLQFCAENNWPVSFHTAEELRAVEGDFTPSEFVQSVTGVDNVCERAALLGAEKLIVKKTVRNGVTVALAAEHWEVRFG